MTEGEAASMPSWPRARRRAVLVADSAKVDEAAFASMGAASLLGP